MIRIYEVGGCVRDDLMGIPTKDVDYVVIATSFEAMKQYIEDQGFKIFLAKPEYGTIRAAIPEGHTLRQRCKEADFVLARKDGPSTDGRRPDYVEPGTLFDDLARRDFTVNAIAKDPFTGEYIDPHGGMDDIFARELNFVGDPMQRIKEDGLRVLRALRFAVTKGFDFGGPTEEALFTLDTAEMLKSVSVERVREELEKMFKHDTLATLKYLKTFPWITDVIFRMPGLRLSATLKQ